MSTEAILAAAEHQATLDQRALEALQGRPPAADVRIRIAAPAGAEPRHPGRRKPTDSQAAALERYPATMRRDLLRRLRAGELWIAPDGLLHEVNARQREHRLAVQHAAARRQETGRKRRRAAGASRSRNRR